ncbi:uncharacterized protein LACBIDRAFT_298252 [Laccaria bicolor S238N-H82]|uniref:Predicted protein n=1 Tax=Laccaria bicolor (strain S238N-H82 / ATCC MYA-4686) TaxID=486041 RepID=B0DCK3_LACBS|nr:uncharacterized protein LACBIDRAFT_298252 [Laccaria bicolor S238N-H82]EDR07745.1 predicted protein [Laccaria bicolor S238N-H82]|eukprot:XP_001881534.1 predicted protein [Laccaria bicolor S238N-H82]
MRFLEIALSCWTRRWSRNMEIGNQHIHNAIRRPVNAAAVNQGPRSPIRNAPQSPAGSQPKTLLHTTFKPSPLNPDVLPQSPLRTVPPHPSTHQHLHPSHPPRLALRPPYALASPQRLSKPITEIPHPFNNPNPRRPPSASSSTRRVVASA